MCQNKHHKGIVLLVVLALMILFAGLVLTFMIITVNARKTAEQTAKNLIGRGKNVKTTATNGYSDCDQAFDKLLAGSSDSIIGPYNIMENLYGHPDTTADSSGLHGNFSEVIPEDAVIDAGGAAKTLLKLPFTIDDAKRKMMGNVLGIRYIDPKHPQYDKYAGKGTFIVKITDTDIYVLPFDNGVLPVQQAEDLKQTTATIVLAGGHGDVSRPENNSIPQETITLKTATFVINSAAFGGTGIGYEAFAGNIAAGQTPPLLSKTDDVSVIGPFALRPNWLAPNRPKQPNMDDAVQAFKTYLQGAEPVLTNPDYTAADNATMFLARNVLSDDGQTLKKIIPSFHRPQLVKYWKWIDDLFENRKYVLRPLPQDHPGFTGSNPATNNLKKFLEEGPWDVDNDNDGVSDGIWIDAGLPAKFDTVTQTWYKPLVSYYVLDMDGKINVNTLENAQRAKSDNETFSTPKYGSINHFGGNYGPAEFTSEIITDWTKLFGVSASHGRYGEDNKPGNSDDSEQELADAFKKYNGINLDAYRYGNAAADWYGYSKIKFDPLGNRYTDVPSANDCRNPYLFDPYQQMSDDTPFNADDLQSLLRSIGDTDYGSLTAAKLRELLDDQYDANAPAFPKFENRYNLTTRSSEIPAAVKRVLVDKKEYKGLYEYIYDSMTDTGASTADRQSLAIKVWQLLPEETRLGKKLNLNKLTLRDDWNTYPHSTDLLKAKVKFAQELFYLALVLNWNEIKKNDSEHGRVQYITRLAQWSVNVIDFIDADATLTPFVYSIQKDAAKKIEAFDNAELIAKVLDNTLEDKDLDEQKRLLWGMEKPEVALTETLAIHNRNVADTDTGGRCGSGDDADFDQVARPEASLYVELYRPGNPKREYPEKHMVNSDGKLNLSKKNARGDYVWRLAITQKTNYTVEGIKKTNNQYHPQDAWSHNDAYSMQTRQWAEIDDPNPAGILSEIKPKLIPDRFVWFGSNRYPAPELTGKTDTAVTLAYRSFYNSSENNPNSATMGHNEYLIIAPRADTIYDRRGQGEPKVINVGVIAKNNPRSQYFIAAQPGNGLGLNVSERVDSGWKGWDAGAVFPRDKPTEYRGWEELNADGTIPCYRTICLQRLADPDRDYHPLTNPYRTVDWNMIDLQVLSSRKDAGGNDTDVEPGTTKGTAFRTSRRWGHLKGQEAKNFTNLWDRTAPGQGTNAPTDKMGGLPDGNSGIGVEIAHTLGQLNGETDTTLTDDYAGTPAKPFLHFPWNDAPLTNVWEALLVPSCNTGLMGLEFFDKEGELRNLKGRYAGVSDSPYQDNLTALLDFVEVPSPFKNAAAKNRNPGKLNLNTIDKAGWDALGTGIAYETFNNFRKYAEDDVNSGKVPTECKAIRLSAAQSLLPRLLPTGTDGKPLESKTILDIAALEQPVRSNANPYTLMYAAMKLSNATTRSNVFAVWVTVGYFNVEKFDTYAAFRAKHADMTHINSEAMFKAVYPDGCVLGSERGLDNGSVQRHRAFYLIDRSIPVGFRRGEPGVSRGVVVSSKILE